MTPPWQVQLRVAVTVSAERMAEQGNILSQAVPILWDGYESGTAEGTLSVTQSTEGAPYALAPDMKELSAAAGIEGSVYGHDLHFDPEWMRKNDSSSMLG